MTEEFVAKSILSKLIDNGWEIIGFDFPQSGTGIMLHPNKSSDKNKDSIIPDIVAVKNCYCLFFENKNRFYEPDYEKINSLRVDNDYSDAIAELLNGKNIAHIYYGIGLPVICHKNKALEAVSLVDFVYGVSECGGVKLLYKSKGIDDIFC